MKLIDKDALVAEIERRIKEIDEIGTYLSPKGVLTNLLCHLNTLEVKEADLEEKATQLSQKYFPDEENIWARSNTEAYKCKSACIEMVEWLKAQKHSNLESIGEDWSEEDEYCMNTILNVFDQLKGQSPYEDDDTAEKCINFLRHKLNR